MYIVFEERDVQIWCVLSVLLSWADAAEDAERCSVWSEHAWLPASCVWSFCAFSPTLTFDDFFWDLLSFSATLHELMGMHFSAPS